jgi:hypothetical protein
MGKKVDRLDNAFLFVLSSVGLLISFIQVRQESLSGLVEAIPFLLLGIILPFYVGYLRGAIEKDSLGERIRGWIYLIIGTISYFALYLSSWLRMNYSQFLLIHSQILLVLILALSLSSVYLLIRWVRRVFRRSLNQYAVSGTALSGFSYAFVFTLIIGLYHDLSGKDFVVMLLTGSPDLLFWISIVLAALLVVLFCEKASADASERVLPVPRFPERIRVLADFFIVKGIFLGESLIDYAFGYNLKTRLLLLLSYVLWLLGSLFWVVGVASLPRLFFVLTILVVSAAAIVFWRTGAMDFAGIETRTPEKTYYFSIAFVIVVLMVLSGYLWLMGLLVLFTVASVYLQTVPRPGRE